MRVIVKFKDPLINTQVNDAADQFLNQLTAGNDWKQLVAQPQFQGITIEKLVTAVSQARLLELRDEAFHRNPSYHLQAPNFLTYFAVTCPPNVNPKAVAQVLSSPQWQNIVQYAYVAGVPGPPPGISNPDQNPAWVRADTAFLRPAPVGIDAKYAWGVAGGDGANLKFVDIESAWVSPFPPDIPNGITPPIYGIQRDYTPSGSYVKTREHGTRVLGIVIAQHNSALGLGITPNVAATMVAAHWQYNSSLYDPWVFDFVNALLAATSGVQPGDVLLLEVQLLEGALLLPVEYEEAYFQYIKLCTGSGRVIVEAAGNSGHDLDSLGIPWLKRNTPQYDSGAIMVSAATSTYPHATMPSGSSVRLGNYGSRIDCYAWGDNIYTTSQDTVNYPNGYATAGGTSGASAIIAGAALAIQGIALAKVGSRFDPNHLRKILSDPGTGTRSANYPNDMIGVMPNLREIIRRVLKAKRHKRKHPTLTIKKRRKKKGDPPKPRKKINPKAKTLKR